MGDLLKSEFFFVKMLYDKLAEDIEEQNKRQEEQNAEQAKMYKQQQDMLKRNNLSSIKMPNNLSSISNMKI